MNDEQAQQIATLRRLVDRLEEERFVAQHAADEATRALEEAWRALPSDEAQRAGKPLDQAIRETLLEWSAKCDEELVRARARSARAEEAKRA